MDEKLLVKQCIKNKRSAQHELFKKLSGKFLAVLIRYTGNRAEAEDLLQDGFIKIFSNIEKYKFEGSFDGWARKIIVNTAVSYIRKKKEFVISFCDLSESKEISLNNASDEWVEFNEKNLKEIPTERLMDMISQLSPAYRVVFNMRAIEGYTHKEIAERLSISDSASKSNYFKARGKLKEMLTNYFSKKV